MVFHLNLLSSHTTHVIKESIIILQITRVPNRRIYKNMVLWLSAFLLLGLLQSRNGQPYIPAFSDVGSATLNEEYISLSTYLFLGLLPSGYDIPDLFNFPRIWASTFPNFEVAALMERHTKFMYCLRTKCSKTHFKSYYMLLNYFNDFEHII